MSFSGAILARGFWLYVWRVQTPAGDALYVGRTGDNSSPSAVPPYQRMGQHLGRQPNQNALRKYLEGREVVVENCAMFELTTFGPLFEEQADMIAHKAPRDVVAALEKRLADALVLAGYDVLNPIRSKASLDPILWEQVRVAFSVRFPKLAAVS